jgi:catechol-2,3-dioxygenase
MSTTEPILKLKFLSHGTLECRDLKRSRHFYEHFLGFEVMQTSERSLLMRLGGDNTLGVVENKNRAPDAEMAVYTHNGVDVSTDQEVDAAFKTIHEQAEHWGLSILTEPTVMHGAYSFYFRDVDGNCWEIVANPDGGYSRFFAHGNMTGVGHMAQGFRFYRPSDK